MAPVMHGKKKNFYGIHELNLGVNIVTDKKFHDFSNVRLAEQPKVKKKKTPSSSGKGS